MGGFRSSNCAMSDTQQLFALAAIWTVIAFFISRLVANWPGRIALFVALVGIPFWELPYGYYTFRKVCDEQAKLLVFETLLPQESICVLDLGENLYAQLTQAGFTRIEVRGRSDNPQRDISSGRVVLSKQPSEIKSQYCLNFESNVALSNRMLGGAMSVQRVNDGHIVARQSHFVWTGMWWQEMASPILGRGGICFSDPQIAIRAVRAGRGKGTVNDRI